MAIDIPAIFRLNAQEINLITRMGALAETLIRPEILLLAEAATAACGELTDRPLLVEAVIEF
ncbi:MAG: hypothetical protein GQ528_04395 [Woeseiaceae bacterium]|nr:hypothetical protein [Woeseiaceae bacterium]